MNPTIVIVAPYPDVRFVAEGWMSRIRSIDRIFSGIPRVYVNFGNHHHASRDGHPVVCEPEVAQYNLNANEPQHQRIFDELVKNAHFVYVHTVHLAINIIAWLSTKKIIVDIHGIVPEEEIMLGRPEEAKRFSPVEEAVMMNCKYLVTVTYSMKKHLMQKYPASQSQFIILPIFENYNRKRRIINCPDTRDSRLKIVYAGGSQVWQNIDLMLELAARLHEYADFTFLSHDKDLIAQKAEKMNISKNIRIDSATKDDLPKFYEECDLGFVLRDENAVNTVACPTKLSEYMDFGIIPIVKYPQLGDFEQYGYNYITEDDIGSLMLPDALCRHYMIRENYKAIDRLIQEYKDGTDALLYLTNSKQTILQN